MAAALAQIGRGSSSGAGTGKQVHIARQLPNPAGFLRVHGLAFGALKRLAELLEVLHGAIHAHLSH